MGREPESTAESEAPGLGGPRLRLFLRFALAPPCVCPGFDGEWLESIFRMRTCISPPRATACRRSGRFDLYALV